MKKVDVVDLTGKKISDIALNEIVWGETPNDSVLYDAITLSRNSKRQGTHETKTRGQVSGGGKKPWAQKGTGRARQGSIRSPQWCGGGIVFGPHMRSYTKKMNRKERRLALKSALSYKVLNKELIVVNNFNLETAKTKECLNILDTLYLGKKVLIVVEELTDNILLATRNIPNVTVLCSREINVYDIVWSDSMVVTEAAIKAIEEVLV